MWCVRRGRAGLGAYESVRPVPVLVRDRERRLVFDLNYHFVTCGIKLGLVLVVSGLLRRAGEAGAQDALVDEQIQVGVDVLLIPGGGTASGTCKALVRCL